MRLIAIALAALLTAAATPTLAETRNLGLTSYTRLVVRGDMQVEVTDSPRISGRAEGPRDALLALQVERQGDTLVLWQASEGPYGPVRASSGTLRVALSAQGLQQVDLRGGGRVRIARLRGDETSISLDGASTLDVANVETRRLVILQRGTGDVRVAGRADAVEARAVGAGSLDLSRLATDTARLNAVGSASHRVQARRTATLTLAGEAGALVYGPARCTIANSGAGRTQCGLELKALTASAVSERAAVDVAPAIAAAPSGPVRRSVPQPPRTPRRR